MFYFMCTLALVPALVQDRLHIKHFNGQRLSIKHQHYSCNYVYNMHGKVTFKEHEVPSFKYICDRACDNRACGHMIFAYFFTI